MSYTMKKILVSMLSLMMVGGMSAQDVSATWSMNDYNQPGQATLSGDSEYTALLSTDYANGSNFTLGSVTSVPADAGFTPVDYSANPFTKYTATAK